MNLTASTMGAAALGFFAMTAAMTAPTLALPVVALAAPDFVEAHYSPYPHTHHGGHIVWKSEAGRIAAREGGMSTGRSVSESRSSSHKSGKYGRSSTMRGGASATGRSSIGGHGLAPYSDIPQRKTKGLQDQPSSR